MTYLMALQILNGFLATTAICGAFVFLRYLWIAHNESYNELRPVIALLCVWIGVTVLRSPTFIQLTMANANLPTNEYISIVFIGGIIEEVAFLCCIRVFAPREWGHWSWIATLTIATMVTTASILFAMRSHV